MNIGSFEAEFKNKSKSIHQKFRILKIKGPICDFPFTAHIKQLTLGGLWQSKQPTNFLSSLSLLSLNSTQAL